MPSPLISDYYREVQNQLRQEIEAAADDYVLGTPPDDWVVYLATKHAMTIIERDGSRGIEMIELETQHTLRGYDIYTDRGPGDVVKTTMVRVEVPVIPTETLNEIWRHKIAPKPYSTFQPPNFGYDVDRASFHAQVDPDPNAVRNAVTQIEDAITRYNSAINTENAQVRVHLEQLVQARIKRAKSKHSQLDSLASAVGFPLRRKTDPANVIPIAPQIRQVIRAAVPPPGVKRKSSASLRPEDLAAILELIDNQCRQFERTPQAFGQLSEEGLRDIMLSTLNAVYAGAATGEAFRGTGKVDIHLAISQGEVFIAEVKFWNGPSSLAQEVRQLLDRLTWRDGYGVTIVLSNNVGFSETLKSITATVPSLPGYVAGSLRAITPGRLAARFSIPSDPAKHAEIHVLAYNLFAAAPPRRQVKAPRKEPAT